MVMVSTEYSFHEKDIREHIFDESALTPLAHLSSSHGSRQ